MQLRKICLFCNIRQRNAIYIEKFNILYNNLRVFLGLQILVLQMRHFQHWF